MKHLITEAPLSGISWTMPLRRARSSQEISKPPNSSAPAALEAGSKRLVPSASSEHLPTLSRWRSGSGHHTPALKSPLTPGALTPNTLLNHLPHSWTGRRSPTHDRKLCWERDGYETLPDDPRLVLEDLEEPIGLGSDIQPIPVLENGLPATRRIPRDAAFTLTFEGTLPSGLSFELKELAPALLQAGEYELTMLWMGENGEYQNLAAVKSIEYRQGKKTLATSETNTLLWRNESGCERGEVRVQKENWWQRAADMRNQNYRWEIRYAPLGPHPYRHSSDDLVSPRDFEEGLFPSRGYFASHTPPSVGTSAYTESPLDTDDYFFSPHGSQHPKTPYNPRPTPVHAADHQHPIKFELSLHDHDEPVKTARPLSAH